MPGTRKQVSPSPEWVDQLPLVKEMERLLGEHPEYMPESFLAYILDWILLNLPFKDLQGATGMTAEFGYVWTTAAQSFATATIAEVAWDHFTTSNTDVFSTWDGVGTEPTNTAGDTILRVNSPGLLVISGQAQWDRGAFQGEAVVQSNNVNGLGTLGQTGSSYPGGFTSPSNAVPATSAIPVGTIWAFDTSWVGWCSGIGYLELAVQQFSGVNQDIRLASLQVASFSLPLDATTSVY